MSLLTFSRVPGLLKRGVAMCAACVLGLVPTQGAAEERQTVVDLAGRAVSVPAKVERILLGEGRLLPVMGILDREDPVRRLSAMMGDFETLDPAGYAQWRQRFPELDKVARVGRDSAASFSDEQAISRRPQVAILGVGGGHGPSAADREVVARLESAGVTVVFVDFRHDPLKNTPLSMALLGQVLDRRARAEAFVAEWREQLARVTQRLGGPGAPTSAQRPTVFLENRVGLSDECCATMVGLVGKLVDAAGGANVAAGLIPGEHGTLNPELLLTRQPHFYVGTGIGSLAGMVQNPMRVVLGADATEDAARQTLANATRRRYIAQLTAVRQGRAYAVWHHFYNSPFNVVAVQAMAKWFHPERFADLDPRATLQGFYSRHMPIPLTGVYWTGATR